MAVTEEARHKLYQRLEEELGHEEATTLMDHLPPGGWANLATKQDITQLRDHIDQQVTLVRKDFDHLGDRFDSFTAAVDLKVDSLSEKIDRKVARIDGKVDALAERVDALGDRVDGLGEKVDGNTAALNEKIDGNAAQLLDRVGRMIAEGIIDLLRRQLTFVSAMLGFLSAVATIVAGVLVVML